MAERRLEPLNGRTVLAKGLEVFEGNHRVFLLKDGRAILRDDDFTVEELELWIRFLRGREGKPGRKDAEKT